MHLTATFQVTALALGQFFIEVAGDEDQGDKRRFEYVPARSEDIPI